MRKRHHISVELKFDIQMLSMFHLFLIVLVFCFPFLSLSPAENAFGSEPRPTSL